MKRILLAIGVLLTTFFVGNVFASSTAFNTNNIRIESISNDSTVDGQSVTDKEISSNISFRKVGDEVEYRIQIKNNSSDDYLIKSFYEDQISDKYIVFNYDKHENEYFSSGEIKEFIVIAKYANEVAYDDFVTEGQRQLTTNFKLQIKNLAKGGENPITLDNLPLHICIMAISCIGLVFIIHKRSKLAKMAVFVLLFSGLFISLNTFAVEKYDIYDAFTLNATFSVKDKARIIYTNQGIENDIIIHYGDQLNLGEFEREGYHFRGWNTSEDGSGESYSDGDEVKPNSTELSIFAQWEEIKTSVLASGTSVNKKMKKLAGTDASTQYVKDTNIKSIKIADELPDGFDEGDDNHIISADSSSEKIFAWFNETDGAIYIFTRAEVIKGGTYMSDMFRSMDKLTDISVISDWDVSSTVYMSGMFGADTNLTDISSLANWSTANVAQIDGMFLGDSNLSDITALSNWDTSKVTNAVQMLSGTKIANVDALTSWDVSNLKHMSSMFTNATKLEDISGLSHWNTSKVESLYGLFNNTKITNVDALATGQREGDDYISWDVSNVTSMSYLFCGDSSLADISGLSHWNTSKVTEMYSMFADTSITNIDTLATTQRGNNDYISWDVSMVENMNGMFSGASKLEDVNGASNWNVSSVRSMKNMFGGTSNLSDISGLSNWNVGNVTTMEKMFSKASTLSDLSSISNWNVSNVREMQEMFQSTSIENVDALANWNTQNVTRLGYMFSTASKLADISGLALWNTSKVTDLAAMFSKTKISNVNALESKQHEGKDYVSWDISKVQNISFMFNGATRLTDISALSSWNTVKVQQMEHFLQETAINSTDALETKRYDGKSYTSWDVSNVKYMNSIFKDTTRLSNITALATWTTTGVTRMSYLFSDAKAITDVSAIADWDVSNVKEMDYMFERVTTVADFTPLNNWTINPSNTKYRMFHNVPATSILPNWY